MVSRPTPGHLLYPFDCRVLPHEIADGATQMALDEALLDAVADGRSGLAIRTYEWSAPTLSLGYFQHFGDVAADPRWRDVPVVRRPTGGGALWHDHEITYAVVVPGDHPLGRPSSALYRAVHEAIAARLRREGWRADRRVAAFGSTPPPPASPTADRPFLCFLDRDDQDVMVGAAKVVGSAQRRRSGAVLQHGSVLLGRSPTTPELAGLVDLATPGRDATMLGGGELADLLVATLGRSALFEEWKESERRRADDLRRERYADRAWTGRR